ncbi:MAG: hypothetical protein GY810_30545 [Aureispira sp.]|nr:hypothetical protein [Aureispira sp.]
MSEVIAYLGFALAAYSVVGNDVIQTLGTFLTSNEKQTKWYVLWFFAAGILTFALVNGWYQNDISYGRLDKFKGELPDVLEWWYLLPPIILMVLTRAGVPVSTTFMILTLFSLNSIPNDLGSMFGSLVDTDTKLGGMIQKSFMGYIAAFFTSIVVYFLITNLLEKRFINKELEERKRKFWIAAQWGSTGFLWYQWLTQDLANIYVYLGGGWQMSTGKFLFSVLVLTGLLAYIFYSKGGAVQGIVRSKTNTADIRSATFIDLIYGLIMYFFKYDLLGLWGGNLPMSTTWIFIGLLSGRELSMRFKLEGKVNMSIRKMIIRDLGKVFLGLVVSVILVFVIKMIA